MHVPVVREKIARAGLIPGKLGQGKQEGKKKKEPPDNRHEKERSIPAELPKKR